ncbi:MAG: glycosyltransferase [Leptolyngbyaceae cyanobacterium]
MAKFLVATIPVVGHVVPMLSVVEGLVKAGHEVWWYTGQLFEARVQASGARFVAMQQGLDYSILENVPAAISAERASLKGLAQLKFDLKVFFVKAAVGNAQDLLEVLQDFSADVILSDSFFIAAAWINELKGIPWAQLGISVLTLPSANTAPFGLGLKPSASLIGKLRNRSLHSLLQNFVFRDVSTCINQARAEFSLSPTPTGVFDLLSPDLYLAGTVPAFEYPRDDLPPQVHFIGPLLSQTVKEFTPPLWWEDLQQGKPIVHVTQGTVATVPQDLLIPTMQALEREDVLVIATTGSSSSEALKDFAMPTNVRVEPFIPYHYLLPHVDVMVTNGGYNGVQMALAQGIPLVVAGKSEDKPEVCARVEWCGVGVDLKTKTPQPKKIRQAVKRLLGDESFQRNAERLRAEIEQFQSAEQAVALVEKLLTIR